MKTYGRFLLNRNVIFIAALILGLLAPGAAQYLRPLILPVLGLIITISLLSIGPELFRPPRGVLTNGLIGIGVNYFLMTGVILVSGLLLIPDPQLRTGFVLMAAIPPAVAIIPFAEMLGGDRELSLFGTVAGFLAAFLLLPLITLIFIGSDIVEPGRLVLVLAGLIIIPFIVSRLFRVSRLAGAVDPYRGAATNLCFGIAFYIMVAANHDGIVGHTSILVLPIAVGLLIMTVSGGIVFAMSVLISASRRTRISLVLLATLKNYAVSAGLGLLLFSERAALPSVVMTVIMIPYIVLFDLLYGPRKQRETRIEKRGHRDYNSDIITDRGENMRTINIEGMTCNHCVMAVARALEEISGIRNVKVDLKKGRATFDEDSPVDMKTIREKIEDAGYRVVS